MKRLLIFLLGFAAAAGACHANEGVILLHGLARTGRSMAKMAARLEAAGYVVLNVDYPSRTGTIEELAGRTIGEALRSPKLASVERIHFVAHSLGGILIRQYLQAGKIERLGRVVMLGPPNQGSEVVDRLGGLTWFEKINGPAGMQLGTSPDSVPNQLGAVGFELGVIAGDRSINWINSAMIAGPDDGKVSVERTRISGMKDHVVIHAAHPFLMRNDEAIRLVLVFLQTGGFRGPAKS